VRRTGNGGAVILPTRCPACGTPGPVPCAACCSALVPAPPGPVLALVAYEGVGRELVTALKYRQARRLAGPLAAGMARLLPPAFADVVTWAPTSRARRRRRGYDQAELLALALGRHLRVPCRRLLERDERSGSQTGLDRAHRLEGPRFRVCAPVPRRVLVVDDVTTTGATLLAAAGTLRTGGAGLVLPVAFAATP
jgi:predicted amidophosphoribosyltransferase